MHTILMNTHKGSALVITLLVVLGILVVGGGAYVATRSMEPTQTEETDTTQTVSDENSEEERAADESVAVSAEASISWKLEDAGEYDYSPHTKVSVIIDGTTYDTGTYQGTCKEIDEDGGTIWIGAEKGGLLAGELAAMQCWWGGGGSEIGVFAHEDGGYQIMVGKLDEGSAELPGFRGDFEVTIDIP